MLLSSAGFTTSITRTLGGVTFSPVVGDDDGDGKLDLAVYTSAGYWSILLSSSNYTTTITRTWGGSGYSPFPQ